MNKANILLVDDHPGKLLSYKTILDDLGENLVMAQSGRAALQWLLKQEFALILLDVVMPEMDGFETATMIRQHPRLQDTPIIFLTSYSPSDMDPVKGYELGAVDIVFCPVIPQILRAKASVFVELYRKRLELAQANEQLHAEIIERKRAEETIRAHTTQLEAVNKELETFSYAVSHDLRAPLRAIDGFSQALLEDYGKHLDAQGANYLQRVRAASQRMGQLIDDLLKLSRLVRGEMRREPVDLSALAQAVADELRQREPQRQVTFVIAQVGVVQGDGQLLRIVLDNLLGNAWKFTGKHLQARIEFGIGQRDGPVVYFVRDDGAGFDMAYSAKLFGAFQRLHSERDFSGTGIGLATVQRIIHRHGGAIWAEGAVEQGATVYFTLGPAGEAGHA